MIINADSWHGRMLKEVYDMKIFGWSVPFYGSANCFSPAIPRDGCAYIRKLILGPIFVIALVLFWICVGTGVVVGAATLAENITLLVMSGEFYAVYPLESFMDHLALDSDGTISDWIMLAAFAFTSVVAFFSSIAYVVVGVILSVALIVDIFIKFFAKPASNTKIVQTIGDAAKVVSGKICPTVIGIEKE